MDERTLKLIIPDQFRIGKYVCDQHLLRRQLDQNAYLPADARGRLDNQVSNGSLAMDIRSFLHFPGETTNGLTADDFQ